MQNTVEVACSYTSEGQLILPKAVAFARFIFCIGTTPLRLVPSISMYYVHLLLNIGINRTFTQTAEVLRDLFKLVKSNSGDLPHGLPLYVNQEEHGVKPSRQTTKRKSKDRCQTGLPGVVKLESIVNEAE